MLKQHHRIMVTILAMSDLAVTYLALAIAYFVRFYSDFVTSVLEVQKGIPPLTEFFNPVIVMLIAAVWLVSFYFNGLYRPRRGRSDWEEVYAVFNAILMGGLVLIGISFFYRENTYSRGVVVTFFVVNFFLVSLSRLFLRAFLREMRRRGFNKRHILVAGAGELGRRFGRKVLAHPEIGLEIVGWVDDDPGKIGTKILGAEVLGSLDGLSEMAEEHRVDQIYIALPLSAHRRLMEVLSELKSEGVQIKVIPDLLQYITLRAGFEDFDGIPVINLSQTPLTGWNSFVKRAIDVGLALSALLVLSPILLLFSVLIKLDSKGPVLYRQERMGLDRRRFIMYKFRSMYVDAESETGPVFAKEGDPRITPVGRFLRNHSLDELPQLFNVIRGEMSLVGPRPERPPFVKEFKKYLPNYMVRHHVKSGMTGWAQVNGLRGNTSLQKRLEYDLYYIEHWSLLFDFYILILTFFRLRNNAV